MTREQLINVNKIATNQAKNLKTKKKIIVFYGAVALATTSVLTFLIYKDLKS